MLFFSYSRGNLIAVRAVAAELRRLGYQTWLDLESLRPGERWREAIERALSASEAMVFCISRLSVESAWTGTELRAAQRRGLPVIPLLIDDLPIESLPPALRELQMIHTTQWPRNEAPARAAQAIARSVGRPPAPHVWSAADTGTALRVELASSTQEQTQLAWFSPMWSSPAAPLSAAALSELARAADEARAAELFVEVGVTPLPAATVLGVLASRLGPARVRVHAGVELLAALADTGRQLGAAMAATEAGTNGREPDPPPASGQDPTQALGLA